MDVTVVLPLVEDHGKNLSHGVLGAFNATVAIQVMRAHRKFKDTEAADGAGFF